MPEGSNKTKNFSVYQIPVISGLVAAAAMVVLPYFGVTQAQANSIASGVMLIGGFAMVGAVILGIGDKKDGAQ